MLRVVWAPTVLLLPLIAGCGSAHGPHVSVTPELSAEYQPIDIQARGLEARQRVTITVRSTDAAGVPFAAKASFHADDHGVVDLARSRALGGAYTGVWRMGLITSMAPTNGSSRTAYDFGGPLGASK
jgi:hypothetical protein